MHKDRFAHNNTYFITALFFQICLKKHCVRMDWVCLNWNTSSMDYYKRKGAIDLTANEKWHLFRMKAKEIEAFANEDS